ncbi:hypothetical protein BJ508DRAFT_316118, partial [Ascobolus immersus RN42]
WEHKIGNLEVSNFLHSFDIIFISEPWISSASLHLIDLPDYVLLSSLRSNASGGLLLYIRKTLPYVPLHHIPNSVEHVIVVQIGNTAICGAYIPPDASTWSTDPWALITDLLITHHAALIGDLNAKLGLPPAELAICTRGQQILEFCETTEWVVFPLNTYTFCNAQGTRSILDHILFPHHLNLYADYWDEALTWSDHLAVYMTIHLPSTPHVPHRPLPNKHPPTSSLHLPNRVSNALESKLVAQLKKLQPPKRNPHIPTQLSLPSTRASTRRAVSTLLKRSSSDPTVLPRLIELRSSQKQFQRAALRKSKSDLRAKMTLKAGSADYWSILRKTINHKDAQTIKAPPQELVTHFTALLDKTPVPNHPLLSLPPFQHATEILNYPPTKDEVVQAIQSLTDSADGEDRLSRDTIQIADVEEIWQFLLNVYEHGPPDSWKRSILVPIPKPRADPSKANNSRGITLQPHIRKIWMIIAADRTVAWAENNHILPPTQNGFRKMHRTSNNAFSLRILHETAFSDPIRYNTGMLQGDPLSPILFILYASRINIDDAHDMQLAGHAISALWFVDDVNVLGRSEDSTQHKIDDFTRQAANLDLQINEAKSEWILLGYLTKDTPPIFTVNGQPIRRVTKIKINGVTLDTSTRTWPLWPSQAATIQQLAAAARVSNLVRINAIQAGVYTPIQQLHLYKTIIRAHFVFGTESNVDCGKTVVNHLSVFEGKCLRNGLNLGSHVAYSMALHDCGLIPLHQFRVKITLRYLCYLIDVPNQPVGWALQQAISNYLDPKTVRPQSGWIARLCKIMDKSGFYPSPVNGRYFDQAEYVDNLIRLWKTGTHRQLLLNYSNTLITHKSLRLLAITQPQSPHTRIKPLSYLHLRNPSAHAIAALRLCSHKLRVFTDGWKKPKPPTGERWCPYCKDTPETEEHAINFCPQWNRLRLRFLQTIQWPTTKHTNWARKAIDLPPGALGKNLAKFIADIFYHAEERERTTPTYITNIH